MTTRKIWHTSTTSVQPQHKKKAGRRWSRSFMREIKMNPPNNVPSFICRKCSTRFELSYSRYGKFKAFEQAEYYCLDCSELTGFTKLD